MLIGLLGPSGSGKTFGLRILRENQNFSVPMSVTTRPRRIEDDWYIECVTLAQYCELVSSQSLMLMTEVFGEFYACKKFNPSAGDWAVIIARDQTNELRKLGGGRRCVCS